jgi:hypothetical protein
MQTDPDDRKGAGEGNETYHSKLIAGYEHIGHKSCEQSDHWIDPLTGHSEV